MRTILSVASLLLLVTASAWADVRGDVEAIAQLIDDKYFDAERAKSIANELREQSASGKFDSLTNPLDLAQELTQMLKPYDGHFRVSYATDAVQAEAKSTAPKVPYETLWPRSNYGFHRIERLPGNIALIEMNETADIDFDDKDDPARRAADAALALVQGADAIIIDLRHNPGGAPSMVGYLVSAFVKPDADIYNVFYSREGSDSERPAIAYPQPNVDVPLFVLTSARTASAAEAIAFTLQSCGRAQVVGDRSAGAANPGEPFQLQRYTVFVATGSPRNPINHRNWEGDGVHPDVEVGAAGALERASIMALERVLQSSKLPALEKADAQWVKEALQARAQPFKPKALRDFAGTYGQYVVAIAGETLTATMGGRLPVTLVPLREDLFFDAQNPSRRFAFERASGKVIALRVLASSGEVQRIRRGSAQ